jgi:hypothetical protein
MRQELRVSKDTIEQHISREIRFFAYPFGGREHITATGIEEVKAAGFDCCLSAYGGVVFPHQDPFTLRRTFITSYHQSEQHLRHELNPFLSILRMLKDDLRSTCLPNRTDR